MKKLSICIMSTCCCSNRTEKMETACLQTTPQLWDWGNVHAADWLHVCGNHSYMQYSAWSGCWGPKFNEKGHSDGEDYKHIGVAAVDPRTLTKRFVAEVVAEKQPGGKTQPFLFILLGVAVFQTRNATWAANVCSSKIVTSCALWIQEYHLPLLVSLSVAPHPSVWLDQHIPLSTE